MKKVPKLDAIDLKILATLQVNGRITNAALADAVGLSHVLRRRLRGLTKWWNAT